MSTDWQLFLPALHCHSLSVFLTLAVYDWTKLEIYNIITTVVFRQKPLHKQTHFVS